MDTTFEEFATILEQRIEPRFDFAFVPLALEESRLGFKWGKTMTSDIS